MILNMLNRVSLAGSLLLCFAGSASLAYGQAGLANEPASSANVSAKVPANDIASQDGAMDISYAAETKDSGKSLAGYLRFYFPDAPPFDPNVPMPHEILGFAPGELHITPETLFAYVDKVAKTNPRLSLEVVGRSHERRPLTSLYISSPENIANLEQIRQQHLQASSPEDDILVLKLAYSVHGNEPSGSNAVPLIAYYLAASSDPWVAKFLSRTVVIIEPVQNPDGLTRFTQWANTHRSEVVNTDIEGRNHHASWPSGRTNHYMFDLNRDWIFTIHPESKARIREYHKWKPHVLGDYHEMGGGKPSYFFQPGHPKRTHPLTLPENQKITAALAKFHAGALDKTGQDYYTQERFDDYYYGKGSAYPDINGGIGILFEQVATRGIERDFNGESVTFRQSIANQLTTSFSLMRGSDEMRERIMDYRFAFRDEEARRARQSKNKAYIFSDDGDPQRAYWLLDMLKVHEIKIYELARPVNRGRHSFNPGSAWVVPASADKYGLVTSMFELRTRFEDNIFYDVSTWNLPLAFNLPYAALSGTGGLLGANLPSSKPEPVHTSVNRDAVAYAIRWNQLEAPRFLQTLLNQGISPRVAAKPFTSDLLTGGSERFDQGTLVLRMHDDKAFEGLAKAIKAAPSVIMEALSTGLTSDGPDIGSPEMDVIYPVKLALIVGKGVRTTEAGEIVYLFDKQVGMPVTLIDADRIKSADLSKYTHLLMADGTYSLLNGGARALRTWVNNGGIIIAQKRGAEWAYKKIVTDPKKEQDDKEEDKSDEADKKEKKEYRAYLDYDSDRGERSITGAIFNADIDLTHPFTFGYTRPVMPLLKTWNKTLERSGTSYDMPVRYTANPLVSGFVGDKKLDEIKGTPALVLHRVKKGYVVALADNLNFRGYWRGTSRLYLNIIFFTQTLNDRKDED